VLINREGVAQLCDFGLVRLIHDQTATGLTTTTAHTGTARYLSLELVEADEGTMPTTASDIWALGCVGMEVNSYILFTIQSLTPHQVHLPATSI
jgi:serine/threonine protein kinase